MEIMANGPKSKLQYNRNAENKRNGMSNVQLLYMTNSSTRFFDHLLICTGSNNPKNIPEINRVVDLKQTSFHKICFYITIFLTRRMIKIISKCHFKIDID